MVKTKWLELYQDGINHFLNSLPIGIYEILGDELYNKLYCKDGNCTEPTYICLKPTKVCYNCDEYQHTSEMILVDSHYYCSNCKDEVIDMGYDKEIEEMHKHD